MSHMTRSGKPCAVGRVSLPCGGGPDTDEDLDVFIDRSIADSYMEEGTFLTAHISQKKKDEIYEFLVVQVKASAQRLMFVHLITFLLHRHMDKLSTLFLCHSI